MVASLNNPTEESVIMMAFDNSADEHMIVNAYLESLKQAQAMQGNPYRLVDLRGAGEAYRTVVATLQELMKGVSGAGVDPEMLCIIIGSEDMADVCAPANLPLFTNPTEALVYLASQMNDPVRTI